MYKGRRALALTSIALLLATTGVACGKSKDKESSATPPAETTTTVAQLGPVAALTGVPLADEGLRNRPVLTVKVDNSPEARPQFGLDKADDIVEEKVEGGISRFMVLFQSQDADRVGPVRSLRSTDAYWLKPESGMIAYSGGIDPVKKLLPQNGITDLGADTHGVKYYKRRSDRPYEHSMYISTNVMRELTPKDEGGPKALYQYIDPGASFGGAGVAPVTGVSGSMANLPTATSFAWTWDAGSGVFRRSTDGKSHEFEGVGQIGMKNVILQFVGYEQTPWRDRANSPVDQAVTTGSGDAWILSNGQLVKGHWSRPNADDITAFTDASGAPIKLQRGQTWLTLVPSGQTVTAQ